MPKKTKKKSVRSKGRRPVKGKELEKNPVTGKLDKPIGMR